MTTTTIHDSTIELIKHSFYMDTGIKEAYLFPSSDEIRIVYLDENSPKLEEDEYMAPFYFRAHPGSGFNHRLANVVINPVDKIQRQPPNGWGDWNDAEQFNPEKFAKLPSQSSLSDEEKQIMPNDDLFMVFDVEAVGLHGEGYAVGYTVINSKGSEEGFGCIYCDPGEAKGSDEDREWITENVTLPKADMLHPNGEIRVEKNPRGVRQAFWNMWEYYRNKGALLVSDCAYPVETNFLETGYLESEDRHKDLAPYPLMDVSSILLAAGMDPVGTYARLPTELPAHNPLNDARQSSRVFVDALAKIHSNIGRKSW